MANLFTGIMGKLGMGAVGASALTYAVDAGMTYSSYKTDRAQGHNKIYSAAHSIASTILFNEFMVPAIALSLAPLAGAAHQMYTNSVAKRQRAMTPMGGVTLPDTQAAQTSRQRSLAAIAQARMSARNALGNEAGMYAPRFR